MAKLSSCCGLCPALALTLLLCAVSTDPPPNSRALRGEAQKQQPSPQWNQKRAEGLAAHGVCNMGAWNQNDLAKYGLAVQGGGGGDQAYYMNGVHRNVANLTSYEAMGYQSCGTPGAPACEKCNAQPWPSNRSRTLRKEVRTLSRAELQAFVRSFWVMRNTSEEQGRTLYGPDFHSLPYLSAKHYTAAFSPAGDALHFGSGLMSGHAFEILETEASLLAICKGLYAAAAAGCPLRGLPYWDWTADCSPAVAPDKDPNQCTSAGPLSARFFEIFGSKSGNYSESGALTDGCFANFPAIRAEEAAPLIPEAFAREISGRCQNEKWCVPPSPGVLPGLGNSAGFFRSPQNANKNPKVTRGPFPLEAVHNSLYSLDSEAWDRCARVDAGQHVGFQCIEFAGSMHSQSYTNNGVGQHGMIHIFLGGMLLPGDGRPSRENIKEWIRDKPKPCHPLDRGDPSGLASEGSFSRGFSDNGDTAASPAEPLFFMLHSNLERLRLLRMKQASPEVAARYYDYPAAVSVSPHTATLLNHVVNGNYATSRSAEAGFPFKLGHLMGEGAPAGANTYADAMCWLSPSAAPYEYDTLDAWQGDGDSRKPHMELQLSEGPVDCGMDLPSL
ncbi:unnamed protein product [Polarella glacialis]|uniref:Tyrosinase copper-binding domain-containing protein n=1 Tax=Polarella glacialis TaxID=89957 RepID=A0A813GUI6_POLGL|nr:unnamed protein product [Polarella glacialis]